MSRSEPVRRALRRQLRNVLSHGQTPTRKAVMRALTHQVTVQARKQVYPTFRRGPPNGVKAYWQPQRDSNPCLHLESAFGPFSRVGWNRCSPVQWGWRPTATHRIGPSWRELSSNFSSKTFKVETRWRHRPGLALKSRPFGQSPGNEEPRGQRDSETLDGQLDSNRFDRLHDPTALGPDGVEKCRALSQGGTRHRAGPDERSGVVVVLLTTGGQLGNDDVVRLETDRGAGVCRLSLTGTQRSSHPLGRSATARPTPWP